MEDFGQHVKRVMNIGLFTKEQVLEFSKGYAKFVIENFGTRHRNSFWFEDIDKAILDFSADTFLENYDNFSMENKACHCSKNGLVHYNGRTRCRECGRVYKKRDIKKMFGDIVIEDEGRI